MKGDTSVCHTSCFRINARRTTMSMSPFSMKCETHVYYACLPYDEKGDTCNKGASCIGCSCPKISGHVLSLAILSSFLKPLITRPSVTRRLSCRRYLPSLIPALEKATALIAALEHAAASSPTLSTPPSTSSKSPIVLNP
jgi:hypothetical protein